MIHLLKKRIDIALVIVFLTVWAITASLYRANSHNDRAQYLAQANQSYAEKINLTIDRYSDFSNYLFLTLIDEQTTAYMAQANAGDPLLKDAAREALYKHLIDSYETILEFNFRQLHFHLPNGDSFLRFHTPQTYGDNLLNARTSIRIANTELRSVQGFEEGRVYNGFRFVYPVFHEGTHVGSVEISISIATILDTLFVIEPSSTHNFNIKRSVVEALVFDEFLENYIPSLLNENYLFDLQVAERFIDRRTLLEGETFQSFLRTIKDDVFLQLEAEADFSFHTTFERAHYTAHFVSIRNIDDVHVGYIFSVSEDLDYYGL